MLSLWFITPFPAVFGKWERSWPFQPAETATFVAPKFGSQMDIQSHGLSTPSIRWKLLSEIRLPPRQLFRQQPPACDVLPVRPLIMLGDVWRTKTCTEFGHWQRHHNFALLFCTGSVADVLSDITRTHLPLTLSSYTANFTCILLMLTHTLHLTHTHTLRPASHLS